MARPLRIEYEGAWYHVMNRGLGRRQVFHDAAGCGAFLALLGDLQETFGVETHAYCLMGNHYHLLLKTPRGNLGRAMRHLGGVFTQRVNRTTGRDGPLFRGRYKAILVDADAYLARLSRYIHRNPVSAGLCRGPIGWRWSSYPAYAGVAAAPIWLHVGETLALFGGRGARQRYCRVVEDGEDDELAAFYDRGRLEPVLGSEAFRRRLKETGRIAATVSEVPEVRGLVRPPPLERIVAATADAFGVAPNDLRRPARGRPSPARNVAIALARVVGGHSLVDIADHFGLAHYASVSNVVMRVRRASAAEPLLARRIDGIRRSLMS